MTITRPQLPPSGELLGAALGALRVRSLITLQMPERTLRRALSDEPGVKSENRKAVLDAAIAHLFPDELLTLWGLAPAETATSGAQAVRHRFVAMAEEALMAWDHAAGSLRSLSQDVLTKEFALLPWVRLLAIELGVRVGAYLAFQGITSLEDDDTEAIVRGRSFDRLIQRYRKLAGGVPREDLAKGGGVSPSTVDEWLAGRALPQAESILSLAAVIAARTKEVAEPAVVFHLRCAVAASELTRWLWEVCPANRPVDFGPPRAASFLIEFFAVLEIAHAMATEGAKFHPNIVEALWGAVILGSKSKVGKDILSQVLVEARDSYLRADVQGVLLDRWGERVMLLYRQIPSLENVRQDPFAKQLNLTEEGLTSLRIEEAWGRISPNPGGWHFQPAQSQMGFPAAGSNGEPLEMIVLDMQQLMNEPQRASQRGMEAQHLWGDTPMEVANNRVLVAADPNNAMYHFWLGASLAEVGRIEEALLECRIAVGLKPGWSLPAVEVAIILTNAGRNPEALAEMRSFEGNYEVDAHFAYAYGYTLMCEGEFIDALRWLRQAVTLNPSHARATLHLAHCLLMTGEKVEGRRWAKQARHLGERSVYDSLKAGEYESKKR